jgi:hypothetical protein
MVTIVVPSVVKIDNVSTEGFVGIYCARLKRCLRLIRRNEEELNQVGITLLKRSIFSCIYTLRSLGRLDIVRALLDQDQDIREATN